MLCFLALISANYWAWVYSKKDFTIVVNVESPTPIVQGMMPGNVEMVDVLKADKPKKEVPLPDPAALLKSAPRTSFGSRTKSGD